MFQDKGNFQEIKNTFLTRVYPTFKFIFAIFTQFPTFHFGLDHSGSQPFADDVSTVEPNSDTLGPEGLLRCPHSRGALLLYPRV